MDELIIITYRSSAMSFRRTGRPEAAHRSASVPSAVTPTPIPHCNIRYDNKQLHQECVQCWRLRAIHFWQTNKTTSDNKIMITYVKKKEANSQCVCGCASLVRDIHGVTILNVSSGNLSPCIVCMKIIKHYRTPVVKYRCRYVFIRFVFLTLPDI